jgi:hypothetical protein
MTILSAISNAIPSLLPELNRLIFSYTFDPIELLQNHHGDMQKLHPEEQQLLRQAAESCEKLDFRSTNISQASLEALSPLFTKLRYLDLRDCPQLQPEQWTKYLQDPIETYTEHKKLKELFCYHQSLTIRVHEDIEIVLDKLRNILDRVIITRRNRGRHITGRNSIKSGDRLPGTAYDLPTGALSFTHFSQVQPMPVAEGHLQTSHVSTS